MKIQTRLLSVRDPSWLEVALDALQGGGLVAFPTDTVYGVGALAFDGDAVKRIYRAKGRSGEKSIPILVGGWEQVVLAGWPSEPAPRVASGFRPGPLALVGR